MITKEKAKNRKLLDAVENYLICFKKCLNQPTAENYTKQQSAEGAFTKTLSVESKIEDITDMFSDLRDYWDTLEVGK
jgi:hypothetical protein